MGVVLQLRSSFFSIVLVTVCLIAFSGPVPAQTFHSLYSFNCANDGCGNQQPIPLTQGRDGNLYGQSYGQGPTGDGTAWKITPAGTFSTVWDFLYTNTNNAVGGLALALDGNFYGTDNFGGTNNVGYVFKLTPAGALTILHSFDNTLDGGYDGQPLTLGPDGNLYGTDWYNCYVFKVTVSTGTFSVVKKNACPANSNYGYTLGSDGKFYGVTTNGGTNGDGTFISMTTAGTITTLHNFIGTDGLAPAGIPVQASDGNFYGTTTGTSANSTLGVIYQITPAGKFKILHTLASDGSEGCNMFAGLLSASDGNLYGTANNCGPNGSDAGTIFQITRTGTFKVIHSFDKTDGNNPWVPLAQRTDGTLYGVVNGGTTLGGGGVYKLTSSTFTPFIVVQNYSAKSGQTINILGSGFTGVTAVNFGSIAATSFKVVNGNYMTAVVPPDAITGTVSVTTQTATLSTLKSLKISPTIVSFSPPSGPVGTVVTLTGTGFTGATQVSFGGVKATFTVNSGTQITATVPTGAKTGTIAVTTVGGTAAKGTFTVT
jgi:uncharacterized repeat protein (TIGR03803 family)